MSQYSVNVQNLRPGPSIFTAGPDVVEWAGKGDPSGDDIQSIPAALTQTSSFTKAVKKGIFQVLSAEDPSVALAAERQRDAVLATAESDASVLEGVMTLPDSAVDLVIVQCLISGQSISMKVMDLDTKPPLAPEFEDRAGEFVQMPTGELNSEGKPVIKWIRSIIDTPTSA